MSDQTIPQLVPQEPVTSPGEVFPGSVARLESSLRQREEVERETWAASMRAAIKTDPTLYAQADKLALENGVTADFAMRNMDFLRGMSRMKQMRDEKIESTNPTWFRSMQSVEFARKAWDDDQLPWTEKWSRAWESGQLTTERGRLATRAMFTPGEMSQDDKDALEKVSQRLQEIGPVTGFFPSAIEIIGQQAQSIPKAVGAGLALGGASAAVSAVVPPATPFTFVAGFKAGFYGTLATEYFQVEAGNAYADMMAAGYDPDRAWNAAFGIGVVNAALGLGGFSLATGALRSEVGRLLTKKALAEAAEETGSGFWRAFTKEYALKNVGGETVSELMEEMVTISGEWMARREGDENLSPDGIASRLWEVASKTVQGMAVLGVPGGLAAGSRAQAIRLEKALEAQRKASELQDPMQRGAQSPLVKRDPATAEAVVDQMLAESNQPRTVFVDAAMLRDALAQADKATTAAAEGGTLGNQPGQPIESALDKLERVVPGITEQIEDAAGIGGDVQIPMAKLLSTIAAELPDVAKALRENLRVDAAMPSAAEATKDADEQAKQAEADEEIYAAMEAAAAKETDDVARGKSVRKVLADKQITGVTAERYLGEIARRDFEKSSTKVRDDIVAKLQASATGLRYVETTTLARTISATIDVIAEKEGITPEQAWQRFGPRRVNADSLGLNSFFAVESDEQAAPGEAMLNQPAPLKTDTPEFRAWFGESKVVDAEGKPLVAYHGTTAGFSEFSASSLGSNTGAGSAKLGFFFAGSPSTAGAYAQAIGKLTERGADLMDQANELEASAASATDRDEEAQMLYRADKLREQALADGGRILPVYLSLQNPLVHDMRGESFRPELWRDIIARAAEDGRDGVVFKNAYDGQADKPDSIYVVFRPTQIKSVNNRGTFDPNDPNILRQPQEGKQPPRGSFLRRLMAVLFGEKSNASTVVHEMVHWYVEIIDRLAAQGSPWAQQQFQVLLDRWKLTRPEWDAMADAQREKLYEDISYNAEDYFATGNAPSKELEGVFRSIRRWIVRIYGQVRQLLSGRYQDEFGTELPPLTPELRGFFDRMLASEQAIEIVTAEREGATAFDPASAEKLGIDEATVADIQRLGEESKQEAKDRLSSEAVRAARFYQAKRRGANKELEAKLQASKDRIRAEVEKDVSARPVYAAQTFIKNGEVVDDEGKTVSAKLDTDAVRRILGDDADKVRGYTRKGGTNPNLMARQFQFTSAEEMLRAFLNAPPMEQAIESETVARLEAEEPLADPKAMRQAVESAMHGKAAARLSSTILRAMLGNPPGVTTAQLEGSAQQAAQQVLLRMPVGQISVRAFSQAEHRAAKARLAAIKSGDRDAAIDAQRKHLLQHYLTRFAIDIEKELDRFGQTVTGSYLKSRDDILKAKRNLDMVQAIRALLGRFGAIGQAQAEDANAYMATMAQQNPAGHAELATRIAIAADQAKPWREMPLERWRVVMDEAAQMWHESKRSEQIRIAGKLLSKQAVQDEVEAQIIDTWGQPDKAPPEPGSYDPVTIIAALTRLEPWTVQADGGQMGGPINRYIYRPLKEVQGEYEAERTVEFRWFKEWLDSHEGELSDGEFDGQKWLGAGRNAQFENKAKILGLLAQLGTEGNRRNVFLGNGWATQKDGELYAHDGSPFLPKFQEMLAEMVRRGILTKQDFDQNQKALDHIRDSIKGRLFDVSREVFAFYPEAVEASPFDTPFGQYPGGYFPSKVDKDLSGVGDRQQIDAVASMKANFKGNNTSPQRGMLIKRNDGAVEPRVLDIRLLWEHIDDSLKIIHMAGPLQDVTNLFKGGTMVETLRKASPAALREIILPAIDRMARQATTAPSDPNIRRFVASARQITSMIFLGLSPKNAAQQFTGLSNAAVYSSIPLVWGSFWKFWKNPANAIAQIEAESQAMSVRWSDEMQALSMDVQQLLDPSRWKSAQQQATKWAFVLQRYAQMATDAIAYMAAREKGVIGKLDNAEGIAQAESAVRLSQGEKTPLDVPKALSGHAVTQLFTQFADYPNVVLNANLAAPEGRRFAAFILTMVAPTLASSIIAIAFAGGQLGKGARDDDTDPEDIIAKLLGDQIKGAFSMAPGIGGAVGSGVVGIIDMIAEAVFGKDAPKLGGETQLRSSPFAAAALLDTFQRLHSGGANPRDLAALGTAITKFPLMPFGNAFNYIKRVDEGKSRPSGTVDYVRGLLTGR